MGWDPNLGRDGFEFGSRAFPKNKNKKQKQKTCYLDTQPRRTQHEQRWGGLCAKQDFWPTHHKTATQFQQGWRHQQAIKQLVDLMSLPVWVNKISDRDRNISSEYVSLVLKIGSEIEKPSLQIYDLRSWWIFINLLIMLIGFRWKIYCINARSFWNVIFQTILKSPYILLWIGLK